MKKEIYHIYLNDEEYRMCVASLIDLKNQLIAQGSYTDAVDDVLIKMAKAKKKKIKIEYV